MVLFVVLWDATFDPVLTRKKTHNRGIWALPVLETMSFDNFIDKLQIPPELGVFRPLLDSTKDLLVFFIASIAFSSSYFSDGSQDITCVLLPRHFDPNATIKGEISTLVKFAEKNPICQYEARGWLHMVNLQMIFAGFLGDMIGYNLVMIIQLLLLMLSNIGLTMIPAYSEEITTTWSVTYSFTSR